MYTSRGKYRWVDGVSVSSFRQCILKQGSSYQIISVSNGLLSEIFASDGHQPISGISAIDTSDPLHTWVVFAGLYKRATARHRENKPTYCKQILNWESRVLEIYANFIVSLRFQWQRLTLNVLVFVYGSTLISPMGVDQVPMLWGNGFNPGLGANELTMELL